MGVDLAAVSDSVEVEAKSDEEKEKLKEQDNSATMTNEDSIMTEVFLDGGGPRGKGRLKKMLIDPKGKKGKRKSKGLRHKRPWRKLVAVEVEAKSEKKEQKKEEGISTKKWNDDKIIKGRLKKMLTDPKGKKGKRKSKGPRHKRPWRKLVAVEVEAKSEKKEQKEEQGISTKKWNDDKIIKGRLKKM